MVAVPLVTRIFPLVNLEDKCDIVSVMVAVSPMPNKLSLVVTDLMDPGKTPSNPSTASTRKGTPRRGATAFSKFQVPPLAALPTNCSVAKTVAWVVLASAFMNVSPA